MKTSVVHYFDPSKNGALCFLYCKIQKSLYMQGSRIWKSLCVNYVIFVMLEDFTEEHSKNILFIRQLSLEMYCVLDFDLNVYLISLQFLSTLFAPLNFVMEKVESILPSSLWHQLTRIWGSMPADWLPWHLLCQHFVDHKKAWLKREAVIRLKNSSWIVCSHIKTVLLYKIHWC